MVTLTAADARQMFPRVVGTINGADLHSGFAILDMGPRAFGVMVGGEFVGCCPSYSAAKRAGERRADGAPVLTRADVEEVAAQLGRDPVQVVTDAQTAAAHLQDNERTLDALCQIKADLLADRA